MAGNCRATETQFTRSDVLFVTSYGSLFSTEAKALKDNGKKPVWSLGSHMRKRLHLEVKTPLPPSALLDESVPNIDLTALQPSRELNTMLFSQNRSGDEL